MKKLKKILLHSLAFLFVTYGLFGYVVKVAALSSTQGAIISSPETSSEYGHVLYFPNSKSSKLNRYSLNRARNFFKDDKKATWTSLVPQEQPGSQKIEKDSFKMTLAFNGVTCTKEDFLTNGMVFRFYITTDGTTFTDVTDQIVEDAEQYTISEEFIGYKIEMTKADSTAPLADTYEVSANCYVTVDLDKVTPEQFAGQAGLANWLDSKAPNYEPTTNYQNIFAIQPTIAGQVNYQKLSSEIENPAWDTSNPLEGIVVDLIENTASGDKIAGSATTDTDGKFIFSAITGTNYTVTDTNSKLRIRVRPKTYQGWIVKEDVPLAAENLSVDVGRLTDISRQSGQYSLAESKTKWLTPFDTVSPEGKNALNNQFILTDFETSPSTTEPSTTTPTTSSTTEPSTTTSSTSSTTESSTTETSTTTSSTSSTTESSTTETSTTTSSTSSTTGSSSTETSTTTSSTSIPSTSTTDTSSTNTTSSTDDQSKKTFFGTDKGSNQQKRLPLTGSQKSLVGFGGLLFVFALGLLRFTYRK